MTDTNIAAPEVDVYAAFAAYARSAGRSASQYLKYSKGEYFVGKDKTLVKLSTNVIADVPSLRTGFVRWYAGQKTDERLVNVTDVYARTAQHVRREDLGDDDPALWELNKDDKPKDPWQPLSEMYFYAEVEGDTESWLFTSSSKGGMGACTTLSAEFSRKGRAGDRVGLLPVIALESSTYAHPSHGRTQYPVFRIVDWAANPEGPAQPTLALASPVPPAAPTLTVGLIAPTSVQTATGKTTKF